MADPGACEDELLVTYEGGPGSSADQMRITEPRVFISPHHHMTLELLTCQRINPSVVTQVDLMAQFEVTGSLSIVLFFMLICSVWILSQASEAYC